MAAGETVLYYNPDSGASLSKLTGVLFRMKVRIRRVKQEETLETVGFLAGFKGFEKNGKSGEAAEAAGDGEGPGPEEQPVMGEEMMVLCNFSGGRLNELLAQMKKAGAPPIALKAMVTPTNCRWSFYDLYKEIKEEHEAMSQPANQEAAAETGGAPGKLK